MAMHYSDPRRETDPHALPNVETFEGAIADCPACGESIYVPDGDTGVCHCGHQAGHRDDYGETLQAGWFWWACFPGCLPDGDPTGPFATEAAALADARETDEDHDAGEDA